MCVKPRTSQIYMLVRQVSLTEKNSDNTEKREANYINKRIQRINEGRLVYRSRFDSQIFVNSYMNNVYDANNVYLIE